MYMLCSNLLKMHTFVSLGARIFSSATKPVKRVAYGPVIGGIPSLDRGSIYKERQLVQYAAPSHWPLFLLST